MESSSFSQLLFTNYAPNALESAEIIRFCLGPEAELARLKVEISKLQQALEVLSRQRDEIQDVVNAHRALLSPMRHIPVEILQHIFVLCLQTKRNPVMHESEAPLLLGRICRRWRDISLGTAELWSSLHIVAFNGTPSNCSNATQANIDRTVSWLDRSGEVPLDISFYSPPPLPRLPDALPDRDDNELLKSIIPYSRRWRSIALETSRLDLTLLDTCLDGSAVPLLESLSYRDSVYGPAEENAFAPLFSLLEIAQNLHRFSLHCNTSPPPLQLPWHQLTELSIVNQNTVTDDTAWVQILRACTLLEVCRLKYTSRRVQSLPAEHRIILPHLRTLCLYSFVPGPMPVTDLGRTLLEYLTVPNLLELESSSHLGGLVIPVIVELITRSSCSLTKLVLTEFDIEADDLARCFRLTPTLRELELQLPEAHWDGETGQFTESQQPGQILRSLTPSTTSSSTSSSEPALSSQREHDLEPPLCPVMKNVIFRGVEPHVLPDLLQFLRVRVEHTVTPPPAPVLGGFTHIDACTMYCVGHLDDAHRAEIENLASLGDGEGTKIKIDAPLTHGIPYSRWSGLDDDPIYRQ